MHAPNALRDRGREQAPAWLHSDSPYSEILEALESGELSTVTEETEEDVTLALRALAVPSDYGTRGVDYVTHAPVSYLSSWVGHSPGTELLQESNRAVILPELEEAEEETDRMREAGELQEPEDGLRDVLESSTGGWMGRIETVSVRPFARTTDGKWIITPVWQLVREWADALESYPVADDSHHSELEWEYVLTNARDALRLPEDGSRDPAGFDEMLQDLQAHWGVDFSYRELEERAEELTPHPLTLAETLAEEMAEALEAAEHARTVPTLAEDPNSGWDGETVSAMADRMREAVEALRALTEEE